MNILTVIPARGGSKGVPGKNKVLVHGKPLIAWTIECALRTEGLDRIVVSSDDSEIIEIAASYDRVIPLHRPKHLAQDDTPIADVIEHLLSMEDGTHAHPCDAILLLQPTAPIREPRHIQGALQALTEGVNSVISVVPMQDMHPARMYQLATGTLLEPMIRDYEHARRQEIPTAYLRNGSIYLVRPDAFRSQRMIIAKPAAAYLMERDLLLNIDEPRDIVIASSLVAAWQEGRI
jgi:CMP-N,N'-diacetyllegionaminic acid synthase